MPLRKKHVRRTVLACLMAGVLGVAAALVVYGMTTRGAAYDRAIAAELESRLRCKATVTGARQTGPGTAAADTVNLEWVTADGRLVLDLAGLASERNRFGRYVRAEAGTLALSGPDPAGVLAALNQRLVQVNPPSDIESILVSRLGLSLDLAPFRVSGEVTALAQPSKKSDAMECSFTCWDWNAPTDTPPPPTLTAILRLNPTGEKGVFDGLHLETAKRPAAAVAAMLPGIAGKAGSQDGGSVDVAIDWRWPQAGEKKASVKVAARGVNLAAWTGSLPGGPIKGDADIEVRWEMTGSGPGTMWMHVGGRGGAVSRETLKWLEGLPAGLKAVPTAQGESGNLAFDRLQVECQVVARRGAFRGSMAGPAGIPLVTTRFFGVDVPLLAASPKPFDAAAVWAVVGPAMGIEKK